MFVNHLSENNNNMLSLQRVACNAINHMIFKAKMRHLVQDTTRAAEIKAALNKNPGMIKDIVYHFGHACKNMFENEGKESIFQRVTRTLDLAQLVAKQVARDPDLQSIKSADNSLSTALLLQNDSEEMPFPVSDTANSFLHDLTLYVDNWNLQFLTKSNVPGHVTHQYTFDKKFKPDGLSTEAADKLAEDLDKFRSELGGNQSHTTVSKGHVFPATHLSPLQTPRLVTTMGGRKKRTKKRPRKRRHYSRKKKRLKNMKRKRTKRRSLGKRSKGRH